MMEQLVRASLGPLARLTETVDMTLDQVAEWIDQKRNRKRIASLVTLLDAQAQLLICQQRLIAVARLVDVAMHAECSETVRRACANLLRIRLIDPYREDKRPAEVYAAEPPPPIDEAKILEALERLGAEDAFGPDGSEPGFDRQPWGGIG